jgi:hypothetical protein
MRTTGIMDHPVPVHDFASGAVAYAGMLRAVCPDAAGRASGSAYCA